MKLATALGTHYAELPVDSTVATLSLMHRAAAAIQQVSRDKFEELHTRLKALMNHQEDAGTLLLNRFDSTTGAWLERVHLLASTTTLMEFIVSASQTLSDASIHNDLISKAARHGRNWEDNGSGRVRGRC